MDSRVIEETRLSQPSVHPKDAAWNLLLQSASTRTREPSNQITRSNNPPANTVSRRMSDDVTRSTSNGIARKSVPSVMDKCDGLEAFLMLRSKMTMSTGVKRSLNEETEGAPHRKKSENNYMYNLHSYIYPLVPIVTILLIPPSVTSTSNYVFCVS